MKYTFVVFQDKGAAWRWNLVASNGQRIAASGESFASKRSAQRAARNVSARAAVATMGAK